MARTWLITGSSSGLGRVIAETILADGDNVVAGARRPERLEDLRARYPNTLLPVALDVTDPEAAGAAVGLAIEAFGAIDVLVNNAGYGITAAFEQTPPQQFEAQIATNFFGVVNLMRAAIPPMRRQRAGVIVNISSAGGRRGVLGHSAYCAAKFAVGGLSEVIAQEVAPFGVKVIAVEPGSMRSNFGNVALGTAPDPMADYANSLGAFLKVFRRITGNEIGDLHKVARVVADLPGQDLLPAHLILGSDALTLIRAAAVETEKSNTAWEAVSKSTDAGDADLSWLDEV